MRINKKAIIIGASGQDGTFLTELLLSKNYEIICTSRSMDYRYPNHHRLKINSNNIKYVKLNPSNIEQISEIISLFKPDEIYNLAAQSSVGNSYKKPFATIDSIVFVTLNILEAIRMINPQIKFYTAGSSEVFGDYGSKKINEKSFFNPVSPYGVAKASASLLIRSYRESYNLNCCVGYLFNHESFLRNQNFVTSKIIKSAINISKNNEQKLILGNIDIYRDWGWAPEYVEAMWLMLQKDKLKDYVIGTGQTNSLRDFIRLSFDYFGLNYEDFLEIDKNLFRPSDIIENHCDPSLAFNEIGWKFKSNLSSTIEKIISKTLLEIK